MTKMTSELQQQQKSEVQKNYKTPGPVSYTHLENVACNRKKYNPIVYYLSLIHIQMCIRDRCITVKCEDQDLNCIYNTTEKMDDFMTP